MPDERSRQTRADTGPLLIALFLVALALRPQIAAIGPLVPGIRDELGSSHGFVGLLTTIPVLCMGLFAPFGPSLARLVGVRVGIATAAAILVTFGALRAVLPGATTLLLLTFGVGIGTALVGPMLAMFVRGRLPGHLVGGTSAYAAGTTIGAAVAAAVAVPLAIATGGWRGALLGLSLASLGSVVAWILLSRRRSLAEGSPPATPARVARGLALPRLPWRRAIAWAIGVLFGMQSWLYYGVTAWLVSVYVERGWAATDASVLLAIVSLTGMVAIVVVPMAARRDLSRRTLLMMAAGLATTGLLGIATILGPAVLWAVILGAGLGMSFTLVLTLPADMGHDAREVGGAAALMLLIGYPIASLAPFVLGAARDATGDFTASTWLLVLIAALMLPLSWTLAPRRLQPIHIPVDLID